MVIVYFLIVPVVFFFFSSRRRHTRFKCDWFRRVLFRSHSDAGVSLRFFRGIFESGGVGVSFGNRGLLDDTVEKNLQRITLETPRAHARAILGRGYARRLARKVRRQARFPRS